jgi:hypothetical protein
MTVLKRALVTITLLVSSCSQTPSLVRAVTIVNGTGYDLTVEVSDSDRETWLPLATVEARTERSSEQVVDQGDVWIFRFLRSGEPVGELSLRRAQLERDAWRVDVPDDVAERLGNLEASPE